jgi:replication factor C small subunit
MAKEFEVWAEKYRPKTFDEIINQENTVERVKAFAKSKNIPHMLFAGPAGYGKNELSTRFSKGIIWRSMETKRSSNECKRNSRHSNNDKKEW